MIAKKKSIARGHDVVSNNESKITRYNVQFTGGIRDVTIIGVNDKLIEEFPLLGNFKNNGYKLSEKFKEEISKVHIWNLDTSIQCMYAMNNVSLKVKVKNAETNEILYDGLLSDIPCHKTLDYNIDNIPSESAIDEEEIPLELKSFLKNELRSQNKEKKYENKIIIDKEENAYGEAEFKVENSWDWNKFQTVTTDYFLRLDKVNEDEFGGVLLFGVIYGGEFHEIDIQDGMIENINVFIES